MANHTTPSKGRIVLFRASDPNGEEMPAIITRVHDDDTVDLESFGFAASHWVNVKFRDIDEPVDRDSFAWRWPPRV